VVVSVVSKWNFGCAQSSVRRPSNGHQTQPGSGTNPREVCLNSSLCPLVVAMCQLKGNHACGDQAPGWVPLPKSVACGATAAVVEL